ncbi:MAG TPA: VWA domain-containing protein [Actinokineospora sp.]|nr:VWA domain-containing protein [Actinokineospora sp.]
MRVAARLALPHRRRRDPFDEPGIEQDQLDQALRDAAEHADPDPDPDPGPEGPGGGAPEPGDGPSGPTQGSQDSPRESPTGGQAPATPDPAFRARHLEIAGVGEGAPGRRSRSRAGAGRALRASTSQGAGVHLVGTLTAAAPHQHSRGRAGTALIVKAGDVRKSVREGRESNLVLFAVDASGSMAARKRMSAVTGAVISLLRDAYQRRDKVGLVTFRGSSAELVLPPTSSVEAAVARLRDLRTGGRTPLADGLLRARKTLTVERLRDPRRRALLVVVTDGRATVPVAHDAVGDALRAASMIAAEGTASVVVDCESGPVRLGLAVKLAAALGGTGLRLEDLSADAVAGVVRAARAA